MARGSDRIQLVKVVMAWVMLDKIVVIMDKIAGTPVTGSSNRAIGAKKLLIKANSFIKYPFYHFLCDDNRSMNETTKMITIEPNQKTPMKLLTSILNT